MKMFDIHSHLSTRKGFMLQDEEDIQALEKYYKAKMTFKTEDEMYQDFKRADVKVILAPAMKRTGMSIEESRESHDYIAAVKKEHPDVYYSAWALCDPRHGQKGVVELERCIKDLGFLGPSFFGGFTRVPYNDKSCYPFYELALEAKRPVMLYVGMTGAGAGMAGAGGVLLDYFHPIPYVDQVAGDFPELTIIASHPAWPWDNEMIAVMLHKNNVYNDLHGWSPKYFSPELKKEVNGSRLRGRFVTGCDYPSFAHDKIIKAWEEEGYKEGVMVEVLIKNLQKLLGVEF